MKAAPHSAGSDLYRPYLLTGHTLGLLIVILVCFEIAGNFAAPHSLDFVSFWGAAKFGLAGTPELAYDSVALHALQEKAATFAPDTGMPFPYAPAFLLLILPFGAMSYPVALAVWSLGTFAIYAIVARRFAPQSQWLLLSFPPVFVIGVLGQNGFVTAALFIGGLLLLHREKKFAAGLVLGCLIIKPQLALMLPVAMLAGREWRVIAGAVVSATAVLLVGLIVFGFGTSAAWIEQMPLFVEIAQEGLVGWHKLVSVYATLRHAGLSDSVAFAGHCAIAVIAAALVAQVWRSDAQPNAKAAVLAAATMLASPYVYLYDALVLIPAFVWLVQRKAPVGVVGSLWLLPIVISAQNAYDFGPVTIAPILPILLLALCYYLRDERTTTHSSIEESPAPLLRRDVPSGHGA
ncbi:glycosyltransferase family 87 protein [Erythrobacter sp.]|uniref:glycosyltransferase family 87 protein n=1 Tax=Erythrobacter sp. TaxID=1042 RepID=UPI0025D20860|nr:glycosyltransferase family 87 protein [Erythrobacter sp.]